MRKFLALSTLCLAVLTADPSWAAANVASANGEHFFRIFVFDGGTPVEDVVVQFCSDTFCNIGKTGAQGLAAFDMPEGKPYEVHVLKVPAGYKAKTETFKTLDVYSDVVISIEKTN